MSFVFPNLQVDGLVRGSSFLYRASVLCFDNSLLAPIAIAYVSPTLTISGLTAGVTLGTLDGVEPVATDRVLLTDCQSATEGSGITSGKGASFNGLWRVTGGTTLTLTLVRAFDLVEGDDAFGVTVPVRDGTVGLGTSWVCSTDLAVSTNVNNLTFVRFSLPKSGTGLEVSRGGTGATSFTSNAVLKGAGTSGIVASGVSVDGSNNATGFADIGLSGDVRDANGNELINFTTTASAVNEIGITNAATGNNPIIKSAGEATRGITVQDSNANELLVLVSTASAVNEIGITNAATGNNPIIAAQGGDPNINLSVTSKGSGNVVLIPGATGVVEINPTTNAGSLKLYEANADGANSVSVTVPALASDYTLTLPTSAGSSGQVLSTNGSGTLSWVGNAAQRDFILNYHEIEVEYDSVTTVANFAWDDSEYGSATTGTLIIFGSGGSTANLIVDLYDGTSAIATATISSGSSNVIATDPITIPTADKRLRLRVRKSTSGGTDATLYAAQMVIRD